MPNTSSSQLVTHIMDFLSFFLIWDGSVPFPSTDDWFKRPGAVQRLCMTSEEETLSLEPHCCECAHMCTCVRSTNRQTSCADKSVDCVCTEMWHTVRELQHKQCFVRNWNYFCSMWEDGSTAPQEPGQQQCFVLLADNTAALAYSVVE